MRLRGPMWRWDCECGQSSDWLTTEARRDLGVREHVCPVPQPGQETWAPVPVPGYESLYEVSDRGRVRKLVTTGPRWGAGHVLTPTPTQKGYYCYQVTRADGARRRPQAHVWVMAAFVGPCPEGLQVNHRNGVKTDNRVSNLEYVTPSENALHAHRVLNKGNGEDHPKAVLNDDLVRLIRSRVATGVDNFSEFARELGVDRGTLAAVVQGRTWKHVE